MSFTRSDEATLPPGSWIDSLDPMREELVSATPSPIEPSETHSETLSYTDALVRLYAERAIRHARVEQLEDGSWFAAIVGLEGAWGEGDSPEEAEADLLEVLCGWVVVKLDRGDTIPEMDGISF